MPWIPRRAADVRALRLLFSSARAGPVAGGTCGVRWRIVWRFRAEKAAPGAPLTPSAGADLRTHAARLAPVTSRTLAGVSADSASEKRMVSSSAQPPKSAPRAKYASSETHCVCTASVSEK